MLITRRAIVGHNDNVLRVGTRAVESRAIIKMCLKSKILNFQISRILIGLMCMISCIDSTALVGTEFPAFQECPNYRIQTVS